MGCLFAVIGGLAPRFAFFIFWIMRPAQVDAAFDTWIFPLLGIIFLPLATLLYAVLWTVGGLSGWAWFWVILRCCARPRAWLAGRGEPQPVPAGVPSGRLIADAADLVCAVTRQVGGVIQNVVAATKLAIPSAKTGGTPMTRPRRPERPQCTRTGEPDEP